MNKTLKVGIFLIFWVASAFAMVMTIYEINDAIGFAIAWMIGSILLIYIGVLSEEKNEKEKH